MLKIDRRDFFAFVGGSAAVAAMSQEARADALEDYLAANVAGSATSARRPPTVAELTAQIPTRNYRRGAGKLFVAEQGNVSLLEPLPERPTLVDFIRLRFQGTSDHCLQSARLARQKNLDEDIVFACLIHDLVLCMMRAEHGFWAAQLFGPYVSEKVAFAIRHHATLRFFPDKDAGYEYPELYYTMFGSDYVPPPHQQEEYKWVRKHRWYMAPRLVTVNDLYSFEPGVKVSVEEFEDVIGRHFKQPKEGLGFDGSPVAHMWRAIANPDNPL
ncbi:MAG TPA: hypothetical protein VIL32_07860 [Steroidobacteraceae bacterium]|jgi:hypothetical protein